MSSQPAAEIDISRELVAALLRDQMPDLAELELVFIANGWDNAIYRLGPHQAASSLVCDCPGASSEST
ncbi:MAG: hypothetical protein R2710_00850 [Acidimicrobiales bacterium]